MKKPSISLLLLPLLVLMIIFTIWGCSDNPPADVPQSAARNQGTAKQPLATATVEKVTEWYEAVGTVRPRTEASIQAQITARVIDVAVKSGDSVKKNQLLVALDPRQPTVKLNQARQALKRAIAGKKQAQQGVKSAQAAFDRADAAFKRTQKYFNAQAATATDLENAESTFLQAKAGVERAKEVLIGATAGIQQARQVINEAEIAQGYTQIIAPENGVVVDRLVEQGDLATPGKPLITLRTSGKLRLEAYVREGLIKNVIPAKTFAVHIANLDQTVDAVVEEIVPYADPRTRTFLVKATLPFIEGLYPGMFGKLLIPVKTHDVVMIPANAVKHVGQLTLLSVLENGIWKTRYIKTGKSHNGRVEVLSGLSGNEKLSL